MQAEYSTSSRSTAHVIARQQGTLPIDGNQLPEPANPKLFEREKIRKLAAGIFGALSLGTAGAAVYAALCFTATPWVIIGTFSCLAITAVALAVVSMAIMKMKPSFNDPEYRLKLRRNAVEDIMAHPEYSYEEIQRKYTKEIIGNNDINALLSNDIQNLTYPDLIRKHGHRVISLLSKENWASLRGKFINDCLSKKSWNEVVTMPEMHQFQIRNEEICQGIANAEAQRIQLAGGGYQGFIARNPPEALGWITDPQARAYFVHSFKQDILAQDIGIVALETLHAQVLKLFGNQVRADLHAQIIDRDVHACIKGSLSYEDLRKRNDLPSIMASIHRHPEKAQLKIALRGAFLNQSPLTLFTFISNASFKADCDFLAISDAEIINLVRKYWLQRPIAERAALPELYLKQLGFCVKDWKAEALQEIATMSVLEMHYKMPVLFRSNVLEPSDALPGGLTLCQRLENEVSYGTLEDLVGTVPESACVMLAGSDKFKAAVVSFITNYAQEYLEDNTSILTGMAGTCQRFLNSHPSILERVNQPMQAARRTYQEETGKYRNLQKKINQDMATHLANAERKKRSAIAQAESSAGLTTKQDLVNRLESSLKEAQVKIASLSNKLSELSARKDTFSRESSALTQVIRDKQNRYDEVVLLRPEEQCRALQRDIDACEQQIRMLESQSQNDLAAMDHSIQQLESELSNLRQEENHYPSIPQRETLQKEYHTLQAEAPSFSSQKSELQRKLEEARNILNHPVSGLTAAVSAAAKAKKTQAKVEAYQKQLDAIIAKEERLKYLSQAMGSWPTQEKIDAAAQKLKQIKLAKQAKEAELQAAKQKRVQNLASAKERLGINRKEQDLKDLRQRLTKAQALKSERDSLFKAIHKSSKDLQDKQSACRQVESDLEVARVKLGEIRNQYVKDQANSHTAMQILTQSQMELQAVISAANAIFIKAKDELEHVRAEQLKQNSEYYQNRVNTIMTDFIKSLRT